jgi:hypothetical protein
MNDLLHGVSERASLVTVELPGLPPFRMETHGRSDVFVSKAIEGLRHLGSRRHRHRLAAASQSD